MGGGSFARASAALRPIASAAPSRVRLFLVAVLVVLLLSYRSVPAPSLARSGERSAEGMRPADGGAPEEARGSVPYTNRLGMGFVLVPAGEFQMGSPNDEEGRQTDERLHGVRITRPFFLGVHEVTVGQFRRFVEATGYRTQGEMDPKGSCGYHVQRCQLAVGREYTWRNPGFHQTDEHPVVLVSWNDAAQFCRWLSREEGRRYRLPTEAEWEYACRAETATRFVSGSNDSSLRGWANVRGGQPQYSTVFETWENPYRFTAPVGQFAANGFGLYDMHGNVWEWCADWYAQEYPRQDCEDPEGPPSGRERVQRGGAFFLRSTHARSANRMMAPPEFRDCTTGFRVAADE